MAKPPQYPLSKSPLYRLRSKAKLANLLQLSKSDLIQLANHPTYHRFWKKEKGKKPRFIEEPTDALMAVHKRLQNLLSRIETPPYLFSGKRNTSHIDNASFHLENNFFLTLDIEKFYPSSKIEYVFRFFCYVLLMDEDVAWVIAKLVTYQDHIPTGSSLSQSIAFRSFSIMFDSLDALAGSNGMSFSLYVDDMVFSSPRPIARTFLKKIEEKLNSVELSIKKTKVKFGSPRDFKVVTGCAITPERQLAVPNRLRKKIVDGLKENRNVGNLPDKAIISLTGRVEAARRIEPTYHDALYRKLKKQLEPIVQRRAIIQSKKARSKNRHRENLQSSVANSH
jgi:hypothetical protein